RSPCRAPGPRGPSRVFRPSCRASFPRIHWSVEPSGALMKVGKTLYVKNRRGWRAWLATHHRTEPEIWLIYYKKHSGKPRIPYNDAVEEALCYGWIDSITKPVDGSRW